MFHKKDVAAVISDQVDCSKAEAERILNAALDGITTALEEGDDVQLLNFGTFRVRDRKARTARNPRTGEPIEVPAHKTITFKMSKALKESINL